MSGLREDETWHTSRGTIRRLSPTSSRMTQSFASESSPVSLESRRYINKRNQLN